MKNELEFKNFEIKSYAEDNGMMTIEGHAAIFNIPDEPDWRCSDIIKKGAFSKTIAERKESIKVCFNHDMYNLIGKINDIREDNKGLFVNISISSVEEDLQQKIREGIYNQMSIGYETIKFEWTNKDEKDVRILKEIKLWEVSIVSLPKHPLAIFNEAKSAVERQSMLSDEFDRIISMERNEEKKYSLMMLKTIAVALPDEPQEATQPKGIDLSQLTLI